MIRTHPSIKDTFEMRPLAWGAGKAVLVAALACVLSSARVADAQASEFGRLMRAAEQAPQPPADQGMQYARERGPKPAVGGWGGCWVRLPAVHTMVGQCPRRAICSRGALPRPPRRRRSLPTWNGVQHEHAQMCRLHWQHRQPRRQHKLGALHRVRGRNSAKRKQDCLCRRLPSVSAVGWGRAMIMQPTTGASHPKHIAIMVHHARG